MLCSIRRLSTITTRFNNMTIDSAVAKLLSLDPKETTISGAGAGSSFASTSKITTKLSDGTEKQFFMKTGSGKEASVMFEGKKLVTISLDSTALSRLRRARITQCNPQCRSYIMSPVLRPWQTHRLALNTLPSHRFCKPLKSIFLLIIYLSTISSRKTSKTAYYTSTPTTRRICSKVWVSSYNVLW
jgi:hypothetical protein